MCTNAAGTFLRIILFLVIFIVLIFHDTSAHTRTQTIHTYKEIYSRRMLCDSKLPNHTYIYIYIWLPHAFASERTSSHQLAAERTHPQFPVRLMPESVALRHILWSVNSQKWRSSSSLLHFLTLWAHQRLQYEWLKNVNRKAFRFWGISSEFAAVTIILK